MYDFSIETEPATPWLRSRCVNKAISSTARGSDLFASDTFNVTCDWQGCQSGLQSIC